MAGLLIMGMSGCRKADKGRVKGPSFTTEAPAAEPGKTAPEPAAPDEVVGVLTVEQVLADAENLAGKRVTVRGQVVKINAEIMGRNWIHLQDGTGGPGTDDLTITSDQLVDVGAAVAVTGKVAVDSAAFHGKEYKAILEGGRFQVE